MLQQTLAWRAEHKVAHALDANISGAQRTTRTPQPPERLARRRLTACVSALCCSFHSCVKQMKPSPRWSLTRRCSWRALRATAAPSFCAGQRAGHPSCARSRRPRSCGRTSSRRAHACCAWRSSYSRADKAERVQKRTSSICASCCPLRRGAPDAASRATSPSSVRTCHALDVLLKRAKPDACALVQTCRAFRCSPSAAAA